MSAGAGSLASSGPSSKPPTRVCLTCRTLFDANEQCRGKKHRTVSILSQEGRGALREEVWGPDSRARAMRQAAKAGAGGGAVGGFLDGCGGCNGFDACDIPTSGGDLIGGLIVLVAIVIGAIIGILLFWIIRAIVRWAREKLRKPQPHGALQAAPTLKKGIASMGGVVRGGSLLDTPWREGSAYAYALELHHQRLLGGGAMLRDARTAGFRVTLPDGRTLRVPKGRIRILDPLSRVESESKKLEAMVAEIDRARGEGETVFPFDFARAITIEEGDRVEVLGDVVPDPEAQAGGYRENAGGVIPAGVPYLRVVKAKPTRVALEPNPIPEAGFSNEEAAEAVDAEAPGKLQR